MGFFSDIRDKIFNRNSAQAAAAPRGSVAPKQSVPSPSVVPMPASQSAATTPIAPPQSTTTGASATASPNPASESVDVAAILDNAVAESGQKLDWRTSIVDLMKAVGIDSSLSARKALAEELDYKGDTDDSATMNVWLHKQVLAELSANGGKVPADLLA